MFFWLSKALWTFADPANFLLIVAVAGAALLWIGAARGGRAVLSVVLAILLLISVAPVGGYMLAFLEGRFPAVEEPATVDGIVLLGGAIDAANYYEHRGSGYTEFDRARRGGGSARQASSHGKVIVVAGPELESGRSEADATRALLLELGVE